MKITMKRRTAKRPTKETERFENTDYPTENCSLHDPYSVDSKGRTPLYYATQRGDFKIVRKLLDAGADPNIPDNELTYPIHEAIDHGYTDVLELLIDNDFDINCKNLMGQTPLIRATMFADIDAVQIIVEAGADLDETDDFGRSALLTGLLEGCDSISCFLIKSGCDVNIVDNDGQSAFYLATHRTADPSISVFRKLCKADYDIVQDSSWLRKDLYKLLSGTSCLTYFVFYWKLFRIKEQNHESKF